MITDAIKTFSFSNNDEKDYERTMNMLSAALQKKYAKKRPPSLEDQFADRNQ